MCWEASFDRDFLQSSETVILILRSPQMQLIVITDPLGREFVKILKVLLSNLLAAV